MTMKSTVNIIICVLALALTGCFCRTDSKIFADKNASRITASSVDAVTETVTGKVAGYIENGLAIFKGIPYATALRFELPQTPESWEGIRSCRAYGPVCPQAVRTGWQSDELAFAFNWDDGFPGEDCLRLNIWTPGLDARKKRPVMVWLHGGGYSAGSGQELPAYDAASLACQGCCGRHPESSVKHFGISDFGFGEKYSLTGNPVFWILL